MPKGIAKNKSVSVENEEAKQEPDLMEVLQGLSAGLQNLTDDMSTMKKQVSEMKDGGVNKFKDAAREEDIKSAQKGRETIDPKLSSIVNEMLGEDFGVQLRPMGDRPGFKFTVIVPERLSDNARGQKPVPELDEEGNPTGNYVKDAVGNVKMEQFMPEDRRSRVISSTDSYDAVKQHCEKVRGYIVSHFQKTERPLPEFKVS